MPMEKTDKRSHWFAWVLLFDTLQRALCQCSGSSLSVSASETPGKFTSPGYPTIYANDLSCSWLIDSGVAGQSIVIYSDHYNMDCPLGDTFSVFDGSTTSDATLVNAACGSDLDTQLYVSSDRYVLVTFTSDSANQGQGFQITYVSAPDTSATGCTSEYTLTASSSIQYLTSNSFPSKYSSNSNCRWLISAPGSLSTISITIVWSEIEDDSICEYDYMKIYDGSSICENTPLLVTDCSTRTDPDVTPTTYTSTSNNVLIVFGSDDSVNKYGFIIQYSATIAYTTASTVTSTVVVTPSAASTASSGSQSSSSSQTNTETELNIPLMVASAATGAGSVLAVLAIMRLVKYLKVRKKSKKGIMTVQTIAPLPARNRLFTSRNQTGRTNVLALV